MFSLARSVIGICAAIWMGWSMPATAHTASDAPDLIRRLTTAIQDFSTGYTNWNASFMVKAAKEMEALCVAYPHAHAPHYWLTVAGFHLALAYGEERTDATARHEARRWRERAQQACSKAIAIDATYPETHALLAALIGLRLADEPGAALWLGPAYVRARDKARQLGARNPRAQYLLGTSALHAPAFLGGRPQALTHFLAANLLFEEESRAPQEPLKAHWGRASALAFTGWTLQLQGDLEQASRYYQQALAIQPGEKLAQRQLAKLRPSPPAVIGGKQP